MGFGYRVVTLRWNNLPLAPHLVCGASSPPRLPSSYSSSSPGRGLEASTNLTTLSVLSSVITEEGDFTDKDTCKVSVVRKLDGGFSQTEEKKVSDTNSSPTIQTKAAGKRPRSGLDYMASASSNHVEGFVLHSSRPSQFGLLLKNIDILEESVADSGGQKLEKDILFHLDRLGALEIFNTYLTRTLQRNVLDFPDVLTESIEEGKLNHGSGKSTLDLSDVPTARSKEKCMQFVTHRGPVEKIIISTGKKDQRLNSRERAMKMQRAVAYVPSPSQNMEKGVGRLGRKSNSKRTRLKIARNEAEFSRGVKVVSELEKICTNLEKETGRVPSLSSWAEAARLDKKMLLQQLRYGWYCRDELIRSTRSLVLFLAKNYKVPEVEWEDLLQAGYMGVLHGAERFDHTRGNKFSTYVRFWIQKEMRKTITSCAKGIQVPYTVRHEMSRIHSARQTLTSIHGRAPDDKEIANFTGYTVAKISSASKCARVVVSIDRNLGNRFTGTYSGKYVDFIPDTSIQSPLEAVMRQHMEQDIDNILRRLGPREREVLVLRYGLDNKRPKSLEEVGQIFQVSKEWVRRLQKKVLLKIRNDEYGKDLIHYVYW